MLRTAIVIVVVVLVVLAAYVAFTWISFGQTIDREVAALMSAAKPVRQTVTEEMVATLPPPAQRFMRSSGVIGKPVPSTVRLKQVGRMRSSATASWMPFEADQIYTIDPPGFVWRAYFLSRSLPLVFGRDEYSGGDASIVMKALGAVPVADISGGDLGAAGLMRYLNEMMWFPAAYVAPNVSWRAIDDNTAEVSITDSGLTATATLFFDEAGRVTNFRAQRYNTDTRSIETWETPITDHNELNGQMLPTGGQAIWKLADGDFSYIELEVVELTYE